MSWCPAITKESIGSTKRTGSSAASASSSSCWTASAEASAPELEPARGLPAEGWAGAFDEDELELEPPLTSTPFLRAHITSTINKSANCEANGMQYGEMRGDGSGGEYRPYSSRVVCTRSASSSVVR